MDIKHLRHTIRQQRRALGPAGQALAAEGLESQLRQSPLVQQARRIGLYLVNDGEIDPAGFMRWSFTQGRHCYLPVIDGQPCRPMMFAEITPDSHFTLNRFGIPEPAVETKNLISAKQLDLVLVPLVAFDLNGNRIGMGGGFYDRTLAFSRQRPYDQRPKLIGLAHEFQYREGIQPAEWDVPLDGIATDKRYQLFHP